MKNVFDILKERGFIENTTHKSEIYEYLNNNKAVCYIGFDPTADSLHVGSLVPIMSLAHMQKTGHKPIVLIGGGTGLIGDPSGKTQMRKMLSGEAIEQNIKGIKTQLSRFIDFDENRAVLVDNADWLGKLGYIEFLRDIGKSFSVNRMLKAESYKQRLDSEEGLSFIEFNYMLLQAYDFFELFKKYNCKIQMGGSDQWGNIVAGIDLIRRKGVGAAFGITFPLITTSTGEKMGKTAKGAVWLDPERTSPYEYYQFWVNTDDRDVNRFLMLFTFLPRKEIESIECIKDSEINAVKSILAFETTALVHGTKEAIKAYNASISMFGLRDLPVHILPSSAMHKGILDVKDESVPVFEIDNNLITEGIPLFKLFFIAGLSKSGGEARRLIKQGGGYLNGKRVLSFDYIVSKRDIIDGGIILKAGKKRFCKIILKST